MGESMLKIGDMARAAGISVRAVRYYDQEGLLSPKRRSFAGFRLYDTEDLGRLRRIVALKCLGLSLRDIALLLERENAAASAIFERQREKIAAEIAELRRVDSALASAVAAASSSCGIDWTILMSALDAGREEHSMNSFSLSAEQYHAATMGAVASIQGKKGVSETRGRVIRIAVLAAIALVLAVFRQYVALGMFLVALIALYVPILTKSKTMRTNVQARIRRLTSLPYKISVEEEALVVEYGRSSFRMPFEQLLVRPAQEGFYWIAHELGLNVYVPATSLGEADRAILERHLGGKGFDWAAKNAAAR
jgi:Predicted transcriptional regulators